MAKRHDGLWIRVKMFLPFDGKKSEAVIAGYEKAGELPDMLEGAGYRDIETNHKVGTAMLAEEGEPVDENADVMTEGEISDE